MAEPLKLRTHHNVTIFNKDMLLGALAGSFLFAAGPVVFGIAIAAGALLGGYAGKKRLQKENDEGKIVTTPSLINKEALIGGMTGAQVAFWIGAVAVAPIVAPLLGPGLLSFVGSEALSQEAILETMKPVLTALGTWATSVAGSAAAGAYIGAKAGYQRMERELDMAEEQERGNQFTREPAKEKACGCEHAPELAAEKKYAELLRQERTAGSQEQAR